MEKAQARKLAFFLPNTFTALNMGCGFASVIFAINGDIYKASMVLILGAIFDSVDGRVARMTGTQSTFGEQFDSISDVVSFGVAPAMLIWSHFLRDTGRIGLLVAFIYLLCGALRLARFNANIDRVSSSYFQGLPIPGAASGIVGFCLLSTEIPFLVEFKPLAIAYSLFFSFLMISNIPFNSFKNSEWVKKHKKRTLFTMFILIAATFVYEQYMIAAIILTYVLSSLVYFFLNKGKFEDVFQWKSEDDQ
tara:strand:+ start:7370 stop:8116 length:747 start_codon:yes stop_codon:yes gene_type:complete